MQRPRPQPVTGGASSSNPKEIAMDTPTPHRSAHRPPNRKPLALLTNAAMCAAVIVALGRRRRSTPAPTRIRVTTAPIPLAASAAAAHRPALPAPPPSDSSSSGAYSRDSLSGSGNRTLPRRRQHHRLDPPPSRNWPAPICTLT
ncbi:hypothetical protein I550_1910 [Mycobacterium intracellulare 1956]|uniref:Uncharacterized protein n=1 Tax=Mycobacterium intracellulare 1956 TaxID=1299331 RepID=X8CQW1_MYCIT|nr:hypothetical protein I550_1910 [Mycobacterium intracellulare 1956]